MKHFLSFVLAGLTVSGYAIPFDNSSGAPATVVVNEIGGAGVDYTSLREAADAFNAVSGNINRTWTVLIDSNLTEPKRIAFGNTVTPGNKLIVKPNVGKTPTVTFTALGAPRSTGYYGCLIFGTNTGGLNDGDEDVTPTGANIFENEDAFVLDGSNTENGTTRDLTIENVDGDLSQNIVRVLGKSNGTIIKNTRIIQNGNGGTANCMAFAGNYFAGFGSDGGNFKSDNCIVENCYFQSLAPSGGATTGIGINAILGGLQAPRHFENHIYRNNDFNVKHRGIGVHYIVNSIYEGNRISVKNTNLVGGGLSAGIIHLLQNTPDFAYDMTIRNNVIHTLETANPTAGAFGILGMDLGVAGGPVTYKVYNNVVTGFSQTTTGEASDQIAIGIRLAASAVNCEIDHNSINLDLASNLKVTGVTAGRLAGLVISSNLGGEDKKIRNNMVRVNTGVEAGVAYRSGTGLVTDGSGNNFVKIGGGNLAHIVGRFHADLAALIADGTDGPKYGVGGAQSVDPATLSPAWDTAVDAQWPLSFASEPVGLGKADVSTIETDIKGVNRGLANVYPGAYASISSQVSDWSTY